MPEITAHIALIDDDKNILQSLSIFLKQQGLDISCFSDGQEALHSLVQEPVDLVILDIKMPRLDGMKLLERLRKHSLTPVIFLTSKDEEADEVAGLQIGADDYIRKPFSQRLLLERIKAVLRRHQPRISSPTALDNTASEKTIHKGSLTLNPARHECAWKGQAVPLTVSEFLLLKLLATFPGHVKTRDQLIDITYGQDYYADDRTIDSHIKRIRHKFKKIDSGFDQIETLYGLGYRYKPELNIK